MRFRWDEKPNPNRHTVFSSFLSHPDAVVPLELIHSKKVYVLNEKNDTLNLQGDGMITQNPRLVPSITVADCMPIYLYDPVTGCFGILHSGWKGTGIVTEALSLAQKTYGAKPEDFSVTLGPHIHSCCYEVDWERYELFTSEFGNSAGVKKNVQGIVITTDRDSETNVAGSDTKYYLSLLDANLALVKQAGVLPDNVCVITDCTSCSSDTLGSFRRQTAHLDSDADLEERYLHFTPMAAGITSSRAERRDPRATWTLPRNSISS